MNELEKQNLIETLNLCSAIIKPGALKIYNHERFIYKYTLEKNMPYLGICAGMQVMASHGKESIENERNIDSSHHSHEQYAHSVKIIKNTKLYDILKEEEIMVNSRHNNHIKDNGIQTISALSNDNIIEAIENSNSDFNIGVQWHPELLPESDQNSVKLFGNLIDSAEKYQKRLVK
jgi:putative glutamine amidotransferase